MDKCCMTLGQACSLKAGKFVSAKDIVENNSEELYPCYGGNGIRGYVREFSYEGEYPLIGRQGALCGNVNFATGKFRATEHAVVVKPNIQMDVRWLYYKLLSMNLGQYATGAAQPGLAVAKLEGLPFTMPSLEEQKQLATICDSIEKMLSLRKQQLAKLDELVKSRFIELFGLPVSNSKGWNTEKMREVAPTINYSGGFEDAVWLLNLDMVEAQTGRILDYLYVNKEEVGNSTCTFDTTNVLYSKLRPYLNKVVIPNRCGYATSELIPLKPNPMKLERVYLAFMLRSDEFVNMINEKVAGAKMPRVSMSDFREFDVPIPPMELQNKFAAFVEQTDKSKLSIQQSIDQLETLKASLMQKYFG